MSDLYDVFDHIYIAGGWNGKGSGPGSAPAANGDYLNVLQKIINYTPQIKTILDIGCGDWQLMRCISMSGIQYIGLDVSPTVINENKKRFSSATVRFELCNPVITDFPLADLVIIKDVLQHLPTEHVQIILQKVAIKCRWALITNDHTLSNGPDVNVGGYRPLNVTLPPFDIHGICLTATNTKRTILSAQRLGS